MREAVPRKVETYVTRDGKEVFQEWLNGLADQRARVLIDKQSLKCGWAIWDNINPSAKACKRLSWTRGPGYRIYFGEHGATLVILLCGSTKKRQEGAIKEAKRYWKDWKERTLR